MKFIFFLALSAILSSCSDKIKTAKYCSNGSCSAPPNESIDVALSKALSKSNESKSPLVMDSLGIASQCGVFAQVHDFDIIPLFIPCNEIDRDEVFEMIVNECKKLGDVSVTEAKPLFESLFTDPPMDVNGVLSIGNDFQFRAKFVIFSRVKMLQNGCEISCPVWENTSYASASHQKRLTDQACQVVEDIIRRFGEAYREANPDQSVKPAFKIRNVAASL
jgi:hypothetical protein